MREPWDLASDYIANLNRQAAQSRASADNVLMRMIDQQVNRQDMGTRQGYTRDNMELQNDYATTADTTAFGRQLERDDTAYTRQDERDQQQRRWALDDDTRNNNQTRENTILSHKLYAERELAERGLPFGAGPNPVQSTSGAPVTGKDMTKQLLRGFEGYIDTPHWDVNAPRVGYGSDTITTADGKVMRVSNGMRVTREDAERDLDRRTDEFANVAKRQLGPAWDRLADHQKAALTSMTYNYGSLPTDVASAVMSGDTGAAARAIAARGRDNDGINAQRRQKEAAIFAGQASIEGDTGQRRYTDAGQQSGYSTEILGIPVQSSASIRGLPAIPDWQQAYLDTHNMEVGGMLQLTGAELDAYPSEIKETFLPVGTEGVRNPKEKSTYIRMVPRQRNQADGQGTIDGVAPITSKNAVVIDGVETILPD